MLDLDKQTTTLTAFSETYGRLMRSVDRAAAKNGIPLGEARILLELARQPLTSAALARSLVLDSGQVSRHLARLERKGLLDERDRENGKRGRLLKLTDAGMSAAREARVSRADQVVLALRAMSAAEKDRLYRAALDFGKQLHETGEAQRETHVREGGPGDTGLLLYGIVQSRIGSEPFQFDEAYERYVVSTFAEFLNHFDPKRDVFLVAERFGSLAGSVIMSRTPNDTGHIRLLHVHKDHLGRGVERVLLLDCISRARAQGHRSVTAQTYSRQFGEGIFERLGWELCDTRPEKTARFASNDKAVRWQIDISKP